MLIYRVITALILAPLIILTVIKVPPEYSSWIWATVILLAGWEWTKLCGTVKIFHLILFLAALMLPVFGLKLWTNILEYFAYILNWPEIRNYSGILDWLAVPVVLWWLFIMILFKHAPDGLLNFKGKYSIKLFIGWFILVAAFMFFDRLRTFFGWEMTVYFLSLVWIADISAYFFGKKFGKTKLAPDISPGKTVEGMYAALFSAGLLGLVVGLGYGFTSMVIVDFALLSVLTVLVSIYGDLFISLAKRLRGVKDSGNLLPGHGGILDRIDSIIAGAPVFFAGILLIYSQFG